MFGLNSFPFDGDMGVIKLYGKGLEIVALPQFVVLTDNSTSGAKSLNLLLYFLGPMGSNMCIPHVYAPFCATT